MTELSPLDHFQGARDAAVPTTRLATVRDRARALRRDLLADPPVRFFQTCELVRVPYPTRYAFHGAFATALLVPPLIHIVNRLFVVRYSTAKGLKILLFSPSDFEANARTPFFARLGGTGRSQALVQKLIAPIRDTVPGWLLTLGIRPEQVDYLSYDHLHTQDLRGWLGGPNPFFPNARLLVMRDEWASAQGLLPPQADWYCPQGTQDIDPERVLLLDGSTRLGDGVALVHTPGHTRGNHSLVVNLGGELVVSSENGVSADAWAPRHSGLSAVRRYAEATGAEVVLNGNTQESGLDQYVSMVLEAELAGPCPRDERFRNVLPSSEFTPATLAPGLAPGFLFGDRVHGALR